MTLKTGTWRFNTRVELMRVLDQLVRTRGVVQVQIHPDGRIVYQHQPSSDIDLLPEPGQSLSWDEKLQMIELRKYSTRGDLLSGMVYAWREFRRHARYMTHVLVWDRTAFYKELWPGESWPHERDFEDTVFGSVIVSPGGLEPGRVVACGGHVDAGDEDQINFGLVLHRGG